MSQDPKTEALTIYASMYVNVSRMTNYYSEAKVVSKKCAHECVDAILGALLRGDGHKHNGELITFYHKVKDNIDKING